MANEKQQQDDEYNSKFQTLNVFSEYLNVLIALKAWEAYTLKLIEKTKNLDEYTEQTNSSGNDLKLASVSRASQNRLTQTSAKELSAFEYLQENQIISISLTLHHIRTLKRIVSIRYHCSKISVKFPQKSKISQFQPKDNEHQRQSSLFKQNLQSFKDVLEKVF